ncbi:ATP-binding protein [Streptomyces echinatus]|uniref:ATP-binding protein n=1 Tax=Streptomyces echinatus TaxID=67293 RepID=UPI0037AEE2AB
MNVHRSTRQELDRPAFTRATVRARGARSAQGVCAVMERRRDRPQFDATFPADPAAIGPVRRRLRACLVADGLGAVADDVALACQELMANAVVHACRSLPTDTELTVTASWSNEQLRVAVHDPSAEKPRRRDESSSRTDGRGLLLVTALSHRWGIEPDAAGRGKSVWLELDIPRGRAS